MWLASLTGRPGGTCLQMPPGHLVMPYWQNLGSYFATQVTRRRKGVLWLGWETGSGSHTVGTHAPSEGERHCGPCPHATLGSTCIEEPQHHTPLPTYRPLLAPGPTKFPEAIQNVHMLHVLNPHQQDPAAQQLLTRVQAAHGRARTKWLHPPWTPRHPEGTAWCQW